MAPSAKSKNKKPGRSHTNTGPWSSSRILNASSPIVTQNKDIHAFLVTSISGWKDNSNYTEAEKRAIIDSLPPRHRKYEVDEQGNLICPVTVDFVAGDPYVKAAAAKFKKAVADGLFEKSWQNQARKAMQERREGKFDAYLQEQTGATFGEAELGPDLDDDGAGVEAEVASASSDGEWREKRGKGKGKGRR